ncbi:MAG: protocatechuate 3,4-dioxygenase [Alteromonas oceani]
MAQVVAGFMLPHDPLIAAMPDAPPEEKKKACMDAFQDIANRLKSLDVDTVIVIGDDHYTIHKPACIPSCLIGIGDIEGPWEHWLNIPREQIANNEPLATHIMNYGHANGVDWSVSKALLIDHSAMIPIQYTIKPVDGLRSIPIYLNSGVEPFIHSARAYQIGQSIAQAIACWEGNERIAVFGTGGLSHWPGMARMGEVNSAWDEQVMTYVKQGNVQALVAMSDEEILEQAGNGGLEIKNWICAMGILEGWKGEIIAYQSVPEWVCGCGFMEMSAA